MCIWIKVRLNYCLNKINIRRPEYSHSYRVENIPRNELCATSLPISTWYLARCDPIDGRSTPYQAAALHTRPCHSISGDNCQGDVAATIGKRIRSEVARFRRPRGEILIVWVIRLNSLPRRSKYKPPADNKGARSSPSAREQIVMQTEKVDPRGDDSSVPIDWRSCGFDLCENSFRCIIDDRGRTRV